jgi:hypothetical protein
MQSLCFVTWWELELDLDVAIQDVASCLNFAWMLQFKLLWVLLFGVD